MFMTIANRMRPLNYRVSLSCTSKAAALAAVLGVTHLAHADGDSAGAQALFDQAKKLMAEGHYAEACPKLEESQRLDPGSGTLLNLGVCYEHEGKIATAWGKISEARPAARVTHNEDRERVARQRAATLMPKIPHIVVHIADGNDGAGIEVKRNGQLIGKAQLGTEIPADPGEHVIVASAAMRKAWTTHITLEGNGQTVAVKVPRLETAAPLPAPHTDAVSAAARGQPSLNSPQMVTQDESTGLGTQRTLALVAGRVGLIGLGVGTAFFLRSKSKHNEAEAVCPKSDACETQAQADLWTSATKAGNVATVAGLIGAAGVGAATALWFTAHTRNTTPATAQIGSGVDGIVLRGRW
jgi:hypothetical protein